MFCLIVPRSRNRTPDEIWLKVRKTKHSTMLVRRDSATPRNNVASDDDNILARRDGKEE